jgi:hypothetical protein
VAGLCVRDQAGTAVARKEVAARVKPTELIAGRSGPQLGRPETVRRRRAVCGGVSHAARWARGTGSDGGADATVNGDNGAGDVGARP